MNMPSSRWPYPIPRHATDIGIVSQYEAVALFIARAQAVKSDFQVTNASAPAVAEICASLDGLPLAIELAARIKLFSPQALLARLGQRLAVLTGGARDAPARQQTLRDTIAWSYHLLGAQEQRLFQYLSIFVGGCSLEAAEAVCAAVDTGTPGLPVLDGVASLIDKNLLQQSEQERGEPRYEMLETIREYGLECLTVSGQMEPVRRAHAGYYLQLAEEAEPALRGPQQSEWFERLEREHENLRAALKWLFAQKEAGMAIRLANALGLFWFSEGHWNRRWRARREM
jgi:predicted ATPase